MLLTSEQLEAGADELENGKLIQSQVDDLTSIFRGYLGSLADDYPIQATLMALDDNDGLNARKAEKLAACLLLFQENQFTPESGFAATAANRSGFNYSADGEVFEIFKYAFGLLWPIPKALISGVSSTRVSAQGRFSNTLV